MTVFIFLLIIFISAFVGFSCSCYMVASFIAGRYFLFVVFLFLSLAIFIFMLNIACFYQDYKKKVE